MDEPTDDIRWPREDISLDIVYIPPDAQYSEVTTIKTSEKEDDYDDTD